MEDAAVLAPLLLEPVHMTRAWGGLERLRGYRPTAPEHERIGDKAARPNNAVCIK